MKANNKTIYQAMDAIDDEFERCMGQLAISYPLNKDLDL